MHLLTPDEEAWVRGGGRLVLAVDGAYATLETRPGGDAPPRKVYPAWPRVDRVEPPRVRGIEEPTLAGALAVIAAGDAVVAARAPLGKGEVVLLSCPEVFQNGRLALADHLALLLELAGDGSRRTYFDEFVHGLETNTGTVEILRAWGFGPLLALAALLALVLFWRRRARLGPPEDDAREARVEAVDFVDSLALLYGRTLQRRQALGLYFKAFEQSVAVRSGLRGPALEARVKVLLPRPAALVPLKGRDLSDPEFLRELKRANDAFGRLEDEKRAGNRRAARAAPRKA